MFSAVIDNDSIISTRYTDFEEWGTLLDIPIPRTNRLKPFKKIEVSESTDSFALPEPVFIDKAPRKEMPTPEVDKPFTIDMIKGEPK